MFYCEQLSRFITDPTLVFWVEQPYHGPVHKCFVGRDMVDLFVPDTKDDRKPNLLDKDESGVNIFGVYLGESGEPLKGEFQFSLGMNQLKHLPGVYIKYYIRT